MGYLSKMQEGKEWLNQKWLLIFSLGSPQCPAGSALRFMSNQNDQLKDFPLLNVQGCLRSTRLRSPAIRCPKLLTFHN